ncbi:hypothetical protein ACJMK2_017452 [Sinanodonta woodiana]|uniref:Uncharacterized protein n=1 Tax=Sinanodonta woodiana TaxID=1069815 RepID=A0ABD3UBX1_SINWO
MEPSESTSLILNGISRTGTFNRRACLYCSITVLSIALFTLLLIIAAKSKRESNAREDTTSQKFRNVLMDQIETKQGKFQYLFEMFPTSFAMTLRVFEKQAENWIPQDDQDILIEFNGRDLRYRECHILDSNTNDGEMYNLGDCVLVAEGKAMYHFSVESDWRCFHQMESLSFYYIIQLVLNATRTYNKYHNTCNGREWRVEMQNEDIFFCEKAGQLLTVHQNNMKLEVIRWTSPATEYIKVPYSSENCSFKSIDLSPLLGKKNVPPNLETASRKPRYQVKDCLFVHGSGQSPFTEPVTGYEILSEFESYWGNISYYTPQCKTRQFIRMNTIVHGWDNSTLHDQLCEFAAGKQTIVSNKIIFSHSMGNLIIAAALYRKVCSFNTTSTEWYSIEGPWRGSRAANHIGRLCKILYEFPRKWIIKLKLDTYCMNGSKIPNTAYTSMKTDYMSPTGITYTDLIDVAKGLVKGVMCGDSPTGLGKRWIFSVCLELVQQIVQDGKLSDGLVALDDCSAVGRTFQDTFESPYYRGSFNHLEGTCIYGDASWTGFRDLKKLYPCKWISLR